MEIATLDQVFRFGGFTLDLGKGTLRVPTSRVFLRPKAYALLTHLARNMGRVVPKAELMDTVWPGVFVTEDSLTQSIREIRKVLGDELVRTVSKRGYMLAAGKSSRRRRSARSRSWRCCAFATRVGDAADEPIVDGFAEDIINGLARFGTVTVLARNSSFSFASYARSEWPQIRSRIGADYLVEGSVRRQGDRIIGRRQSRRCRQCERSSGATATRPRAAGLFAIAAGHRRARSSAGWRRGSTMPACSAPSRKPVTSLAAYELVLRGVALLRDPAQTDIGQAPEPLSRRPSPRIRPTDWPIPISRLSLRAASANSTASASRCWCEARDHADKGAALSPDQAACRRVQSLVRLYMREHEAAEHHLRTRARAQSLRCRMHRADGLPAAPCADGRSMALGWLARAIRIDPLIRTGISTTARWRST